MLPLRSSSDTAGERSRPATLDFDDFLGWETGNSVGVSESVSDGGVSRSGVSAVCVAAPGGSDGNDFSNSMLLLDCFCLPDEFFDFFRRLAISPSWHSMQKIPCDVLAYRRFSICFLQFRHRKQLAQNA